MIDRTQEGVSCGDNSASGDKYEKLFPSVIGVDRRNSPADTRARVPDDDDADRQGQGIDAPPVSVVLGRDAPELEQFAAAELCRYLDSLYAIKVKPAAAPAKSAEVILLLGSPQTNPAVRIALGVDGWPHVTDQGTVLKCTSWTGSRGL